MSEARDVPRMDHAALNHALSREINERVLALSHETSTAPALLAYVCECHDASCVEPTHLTAAEYEAVRAGGDLFLVSPSARHVDTDVEAVVAHFERYWTVRMERDATTTSQLGPRRTDR